MKPLNAKRLMLRVELLFHRVNPLLMVAVLIWFVTAIAWLWLVPAWQSRLHRLNMHSIEAQAMLHQQVQPLPPSQPPLDQQNFNAFMNNLGDSRHAEQQLRTLFTIAGDLELELPQGQYKLVCEEAGELCSYHIQLPVTGSYTLVRNFMEQVLQAITFASLDELTVKRDSVTNGEIEARLGITLFTRTRDGVKVNPVRAD
jgi:hypothetical protein